MIKPTAVLLSMNEFNLCFYLFSTGENPIIPEGNSAEVVAHVCMVHSSVEDYSKLFLQKVRRSNFVTPKNYLDFINTYSNLLKEKDKYVQGENRPEIWRLYGSG